ncbi:MAG TPA: trypsin-like peptidase domain-containing protein [Pseudogracilibacillus sp.]|nr:trypsin-like peptidase domain-containing protein [Pseudogracilibacillus sp.]
MDNYNGNGFEKQRNKSSRVRAWIWPIIIGLITGILLMLVMLPNLLGSNIVFDESKSSNETEETTETKITKEEVNVDVSTQITEVVEKVSPAVVGVTNIQRRANFWEQGEDSEAGTGSGVIYKKEDGYAYIVTNHHVVEGADAIEIVLNDDTSLEAELLGSDLFTDLAVLRTKDDKIETTIEMGSSETLKVGEPAIAIGNPLGHMFAGSVTQGIISGKQRTIPQDFNQDGRPDWQAEVIQTDAAINPGNSGGALINIKGQLIGINSMKISQNIAEGIGFAIPIDAARPVIKQLEENGKVIRPYLGVESYSLEEVPKVEWKNTLRLPDDVTGGVYIWSIEPLSPAEEAGLERLDVIVEFNGEQIEDILDLRKILYQDLNIGDEVSIVYYRDGERHETKAILSEQNL